MLREFNVEFRIFNKMVPVSYIEIDSKEVRFGDLIEVLEGLSDTDGFFTVITIHSQTIADILVKYGAANMNAKHSYYRGKKYKEFCANFPDYF